MRSSASPASVSISARRRAISSRTIFDGGGGSPTSSAICDTRQPASISGSMSMPVSTPRLSNMETSSSVATLPAEWRTVMAPPMPPMAASKMRTPAW